MSGGVIGYTTHVEDFNNPGRSVQGSRSTSALTEIGQNAMYHLHSVPYTLYPNSKPRVLNLTEVNKF